MARAGGCPIGVIDRLEPDPIGAGGVGADGWVTSAIDDTGGANEACLLGAWIGVGRGGVGTEGAAETIVVEPGEDCVDGVLLAVGVADDEETLPNGAGRPLAGDCKI